MSTTAPAPRHRPTANVIASIEARMGSTRLPGKVLMDIGGVPLLTRLVRRLRRAKCLDGIVLATTTNPADDALVQWAATENLPCYRGSESDVLARVVGAQRMMGGGVVVRVCGDTPLIDPAMVDAAVDAFATGSCDVVTTTALRQFPDGVAAQVFRLSDLEEMARTVDAPAAREYVGLYFHEHPETYRLHELTAPEAWRDPAQRLQVDYPEDLALVREIYAALAPAYGDAFGTGEIVALLRAKPELRRLNSHCRETVVR